MKIIALKYGESVFGENYIFKGGNNAAIPIYAYGVGIVEDAYRQRRNQVG